jgi:hypothetical protein
MYGPHAFRSLREQVRRGGGTTIAADAVERLARITAGASPL